MANKGFTFGNIAAVLIIAAVIAIFFLSTANRSRAGLPSIQIAVLEMHAAGTLSKNESIVNEVVNDMFPKIIENRFGRDMGMYVWADRIPRPQTDHRNWRIELLKMLKERGVSFFLIPELEFSSYGTSFLVELIDLREMDSVRGDIRGVFDRTTIGIKADFSAIEDKLDEMASQIVRRVAEGRTVSRGLGRESISKASVLVWCVKPDDRDDKMLVTVSRRLTLELPHFLNKKLQTEKIRWEFVGLNSRRFVYECLRARSSIDRRPDELLYEERFDYLMSGYLSRIGNDRLVFYASLYSRNQKREMPLGTYELAAKVSDAEMSRVVEKLSKEFEEVAFAGIPE